MRNGFQRSSEVDNDLVRSIIGLAMKVHRTLGFGFPETVYRNSLVIELKKAAILFECHPSLSVMYEGIEVGLYQADLIVDGKLIVELKATEALTDEHCIQLVNYLAATKIDDGLVINFGAPSLQFRTKTRTYQSPPNLQL
jgi:GxxExxY protein